jgi:hypothetical protein
MAILAFGLHRFAIRGNMDGVSFVNSEPERMFVLGGNLYIKCNKMEAKPINVKYVVGVP